MAVGSLADSLQSRLSALPEVAAEGRNITVQQIEQILLIGRLAMSLGESSSYIRVILGEGAATSMATYPLSFRFYRWLVVRLTKHIFWPPASMPQAQMAGISCCSRPLSCLIGFCTVCRPPRGMVLVAVWRLQSLWLCGPT